MVMILPIVNVDTSGYGSKLDCPLGKRLVDFLESIESTGSTAQCGGGGGSFKNRKPKKERLVVVNQGWQRESTDGPQGG